ncbi:DUF202 domain-containing protein [Heyndrickxia camelliae]|uniref:DUF202 domain-containing protein n=1 Tax=Heyndrickxia camelliae TaxID=1707093 RepID=A0A2N3LM95_9BACI|nr:DUF202 domain-containing protein [Heyndrickxia camelliae]PKR85669.1 hypothetical protein CWO92_08135 [Heyndrickxia camelliae]
MKKQEQNSASASELLAMERTKLANIRTLLAYIRTSLAFFAASAALIQFFDKNVKLEITAYISITFGVILLIIGFIHYYRSNKWIKVINRLK